MEQMAQHLSKKKKGKKGDGDGKNIEEVELRLSNEWLRMSSVMPTIRASLK